MSVSFGASMIFGFELTVKKDETTAVRYNELTGEPYNISVEGGTSLYIGDNKIKSFSEEEWDDFYDDCACDGGGIDGLEVFTVHNDKDRIYLGVMMGTVDQYNPSISTEEASTEDSVAILTKVLNFGMKHDVSQPQTFLNMSWG